MSDDRIEIVAILVLIIGLMGVGNLALAALTMVRVHELQKTADQTVDFLSDLHAEKEKAR